jgi:iron complex outermembrane receptor protein
MNSSTVRRSAAGNLAECISRALRKPAGAPIAALLAGALSAMSPLLAQAQTAAEAPKREGEALEYIVVTGSRIARDGFSAPTPVSVVGADRIEQRAATNIGDLLNELPSFRATQTPASQGLTGGYIGGRVLDLRGLGAVRTLVLVDGKRFVPSTQQNTVDTNMIPSVLLERAEVVTGGASAAYGSDAVAGVVNFILNENLENLRSSVEYGISNEGDDEAYSAKFAGGTALWGGRAHFVGGAEFEKNNGVGTCTERDWCAEEWLNFGRPAGNTTLPANNILPDVRPSTISPTGVINSPNALRGITFNPDGTPRAFTYGSLVNTLFMVGGEGEGQNGYFEGIPIKSPIERYTLYTRTRMDLTGSTTARLDVSYGHLKGWHQGAEFRVVPVTIQRANPYIPTSTNPAFNIPAIMDANGITSFALGRNFADIGNPRIVSQNETFRIVAALDGNLGETWGWDTYYQFGRNEFESITSNLVVNARATRAMDAVRNTAGQIVCGVNADAIATNDDPACVPVNPFGNQISSAAMSYLTGTSEQTNVVTEHVVAGNVQGEVFSTWAGPVSLAGGLEYRSDRMSGTADPISSTLGFFTNNAQAISGKIKVSEGYVETVIPLAKDVPFAENLELNGAVRRTYYDREGAGSSSDVYATTWKAGAVWQPIRSLRFRATRSRDIRAPNVAELFGPNTTGFGILNDPARGGAQTNPVVVSGANPSLVPEIADTTTAGFVIQPDLDGFLGRMQVSLDYYEIEIADAIGVLGAQTIATRCFQGAAEFCPLITRDGTGTITRIQDVSQNVNDLITKGIDLEFSYKHPLDDFGDLDLRLLGTYVSDLITIDSAGPLDRAGQTGLRGGTLPGIPEYTIDTLVNWRLGAANVSFHSRYIPTGRYNASFIGPDEPGYSILLPNSSNKNDVTDAWYFDIVGQYDLSRTTNGGFVVYAGINNLGNQDPPRTPGANGSGNNVLFDPVGRTYKMGFRMQY